MPIAQTDACMLLKNGKKNLTQKQYRSKSRKRAIDLEYVANKVFKDQITMFP